MVSESIIWYHINVTMILIILLSQKYLLNGLHQYRLTSKLRLNYLKERQI